MLYTNTSPPVIVRDVIVVGSSILDFPAVPAMPPGDVRGFDVRTGQKLWTFRAVPSPGEVGHETWESDAWRVTGNTNVWAPMSADEELGYVYLPFSTPANDYDGGDRPGDNLFAETLVCVEARTGKRVWHYQIVRHGVWDYDLPAAPNLIDVTLDGKSIKAVAQVTKQGFVFTFDRVTGAPLWPIEDRPVPQSAVAGEKTAPTQPFPTKPPAFEIQGIREADLIDFTPELKSQALEIIGKYDHGPLYTPPTERGTILMPGIAGGATWSGAAWDPEPRRTMSPRTACRSSSGSSPLRTASRRPVTSGASMSCPDPTACRCSSRHGAAWWPSTCRAASTAGAPPWAPGRAITPRSRSRTCRSGWAGRREALRWRRNRCCSSRTWGTAGQGVRPRSRRDGACTTSSTWSQSSTRSTRRPASSSPRSRCPRTSPAPR